MIFNSRVSVSGTHRINTILPRTVDHSGVTHTIPTNLLPRAWKSGVSTCCLESTTTYRQTYLPRYSYSDITITTVTVLVPTTFCLSVTPKSYVLSQTLTLRLCHYTVRQSVGQSVVRGKGPRRSPHVTRGTYPKPPPSPL